MNQITPNWKPEVEINIETISERMSFYSNNSLNIIIFDNGTCIFLKSLESYNERCDEVFNKMLQVEPNFTVQEMQDGNYMVMFRDPLFALVLLSDFEKNKELIRENLHRAKITGEYIANVTQNEEHYLIGLYARALMFSDAKTRNISKVVKI